MDTSVINILYIDDEPQGLIAFQAAFRHYFNIYTAISPKDGFAILQKHNIHIIITDQRMTEMTGIQVLEAVMSEYPNIIRIIVSGLADIDMIIEAINTGRVYHYVTKPWDERQLKAVLESAANLYFVMQENNRLIYELQEEVNNLQRILNIYQKNIPEHLSKDLLMAGNSASLIDGQQRVIAILLAEIVDFNSLISSKEPQKALEILNDFLSFMGVAATTHKGYITKNCEGGVSVLFGAPLSTMNNSVNAVFCGFDMLRMMIKFNEKNSFQCDLAISIHTGEVISGNATLNNRMEYTVMGETVVSASKMLMEAKKKPNHLLVSQATLQSIEDQKIRLKLNKELFPSDITLNSEKIPLFLIHPQ